MFRSRRRLLLLIPVLTVGMYLTAIVRATLSPPVVVGGLTANQPTGSYVVGVDLWNRGYSSVSLTSASVAGVPQAEVTAVLSPVEPDANSGYLASTVAVYPERHPHRAGPVDGWIIAPSRPRDDMHGLRTELPLGAAPGEKMLVISYRYLGWPFRATYTLDGPWSVLE